MTLHSTKDQGQVKLSEVNGENCQCFHSTDTRESGVPSTGSEMNSIGKV